MSTKRVVCTQPKGSWRSRCSELLCRTTVDVGAQDGIGGIAVIERVGEHSKQIQIIVDVVMKIKIDHSVARNFAPRV